MSTPTHSSLSAEGKTVFIPVSRGYVMRNVIRSGVLEELKKRGARAVILLYDFRKKGVPKYLREEFEDAHVTVEAVVPGRERRLHRLFYRLAYFFLYNRSIWYIRHTIKGRYKTRGIRLFIRGAASAVLMRSSALKNFLRFLEYAFFTYDDYAPYFEKYAPDIVFSTSVLAKFDIELMKEARRRGVKTVAMPRVWDNVTTRFYRFAPDRLLVQNEWMKKNSVLYQDIPHEKISVCGFPQFDWYRRPEIVMSREAYCAEAGLDPQKRIIVYGANNKWTPEDKGINQMLAEIVNTRGVLNEEANLFVRAHFSNARGKKFDEIDRRGNVVIDTNFTFSDFFLELCDPDRRDITMFVNMIYHADVVISYCSTLTLDALAFDKPAINIGFNAYYDAKGNDISPMIYRHDHYAPIIEAKGVDFVRSKEELIQSINEAFRNPGKRRAERQRVIDEICYKIDGKSSERIAKAVLEMLS